MPRAPRLSSISQRKPGAKQVSKQTAIAYCTLLLRSEVRSRAVQNAVAKLGDDQEGGAHREEGLGPGPAPGSRQGTEVTQERRRLMASPEPSPQRSVRPLAWP